MTDTLKSICEQCIHLHNPQLDFIPPELNREREIILRDLSELVTAAFQEQEKSVIVLGGILLESVLYCFIQTQCSHISARRGEIFAFNPDHSLNNYVEIFNRYFSALLTIPGAFVRYRHIVHINQEVKYPPHVLSSAAGDILRLLDTLIKQIIKYSGS